MGTPLEIAAVAAGLLCLWSVVADCVSPTQTSLLSHATLGCTLQAILLLLVYLMLLENWSQ